MIEEKHIGVSGEAVYYESPETIHLVLDDGREYVIDSEKRSS